ncbi:alpha/beta hydrolase domain-containing protein 17B [Dorcoceras hygrometricum]|uniref:Alpha/beta hydrolase domain-containing protein 17B n=1 Tax=Dorcoceras hygrometricum TaxID=472368 RepID=A0A2Z7CIU7_9LAMI|nr:alpha/beta hydrolase domain-containing protein 17B [Dorcoceras hygrometricum]
MGSNPSTESNNTTEITAMNEMQVLCMRRQGTMESSTRKELRNSNIAPRIIDNVQWPRGVSTVWYCNFAFLPTTAPDVTDAFAQIRTSIDQIHVEQIRRKDDVDKLIDTLLMHIRDIEKKFSERFDACVGIRILELFVEVSVTQNLGCEGERNYRTLISLLGLLATMRRVVNYNSSWARQRQVELFDASGIRVWCQGYSAGGGADPARGSPGGVVTSTRPDNAHDRTYRVLLNNIRHDARDHKNLLSLDLKSSQQKLSTQVAAADFDTVDVRKEVKELNAKVTYLDGQVAAIRSELFDFRAKAEENHLNLSTQLGFLVDYINRGGDAKKGEDGSSRPQPPPDDQSRPSGGSGVRPRAHIRDKTRKTSGSN